MTGYNGTPDRPSKAKAIAAVVAVHAALASLILSGLHVDRFNKVVSAIKTFDLTEPPPPPPPPPARTQPSAKKEAGAPAQKAEAAPIVAAPPRIQTPSPIPAAKVAGTGTAPTSGAALAGNGSGAGGNGNGPGGGGYADFSRFTPARKITKIPDSQYRRFADAGMPFGSVAISIRVNPDGSVSNCRVARSSGSGMADALMCQLTLQYIRFSPARDPDGRPVAQDVTWAPNWSPR